MNLINNSFKSIWKVLILTVAITGQAVYGSSGNAEAIISGSDEDRNIIGVEISETTPPQGLIAGCEGVYVNAVIPGRTANVAGLRVGDIITEVNGRAVKEKSYFLELMAALDPGSSYPFKICRLVDGKIQQLTLLILIEKVKEKAIAKIS
jgi:S1-C subfamily serine protease